MKIQIVSAQIELADEDVIRLFQTPKDKQVEALRDALRGKAIDVESITDYELPQLRDKVVKILGERGLAKLVRHEEIARDPLPF